MNPQTSIEGYYIIKGDNRLHVDCKLLLSIFTVNLYTGQSLTIH